MNNKSITNNKFFAQLFLLIFFIISSFIVPNNYSMLLPIMLFGALSIYIFSPSVSFIYSFLYVIDPMAIFKLSAISIVPILLCFIHFIFNKSLWLSILSKDPYLIKLMRVCFLFSVYQIISILILSEQDLYYLFKSVRQFLGIWILVPAYIFVNLDRKNIFASIVIITSVIMIFYYLSFFGVYNFFDFREINRTTQDDGIIRFFSFDLRQITKIFVYLCPLFLIFLFKNLKAKFYVVTLGLAVYLSVLLAILRTEIFYLFMGSTLAVLISLRKFKTTSKFKITVISIISLIAIYKLFPMLFDNILETAKITMNSVDKLGSDESINIRKDEQLPILFKIIESSPFFGVGLYAVSFESTRHHLIYDIPVLGAFGAYGIIGMLLYYVRFLLIFSRYKGVGMSQRLFDHYPIECLLTNGLLAYFITMISFRTLHINSELAFDFGMAEFGLFIGLYFGLIKFLIEQQK
jgi:hypothetical protein